MSNLFYLLSHHPLLPVSPDLFSRQVIVTAHELTMTIISSGSDQAFLVNSELDSICSGSGPEVVLSSLQSVLPSIEVH